MSEVIFHLAFPVNDITKTKLFYVDGLGCSLGRENSTSIILNLYGHQIVAHLTNEQLEPQRSIYPHHFGLIFNNKTSWESLCEKVRQKGLHFYQLPKLRFEGMPIEHRTFFLEDPFYNLLEFKFYTNSGSIFGACEYSQVGDSIT